MKVFNSERFDYLCTAMYDSIWDIQSESHAQAGLVFDREIDNITISQHTAKKIAKVIDSEYEIPAELLSIPLQANTIHRPPNLDFNEKYISSRCSVLVHQYTVEDYIYHVVLAPLLIYSKDLFKEIDKKDILKLYNPEYTICEEVIRNILHSILDAAEVQYCPDDIESIYVLTPHDNTIYCKITVYSKDPTIPLALIGVVKIKPIVKQTP